MSGTTASIERRMARSAAWMIGLRLADRSIGLVSVLFLARLLVPADFGLVAMGTVVLGALEAMTAFGFEMALIKRQAKDRERMDSAWTLNVGIGALNAGAIAALAPAAAAFYGEPRVVDVMLMLAVAAFVAGFRNIGMVAYEQDLRFAPIVLLALARRVASFVVTLTLAWWWGSYWALLVGIVTGHCIDLLLSYVFSPYRPRFSLVAWRDLFSFSRWLLVNNMLVYASQRGGDAIVGHRAGAAALGTFTVSYELANLPTTELVWPVMRAVFPGYAMMSADRQRLAQGFMKVFALVLLFALPAAAGIALLAEPMVAVLLGPRWTEAGPLIMVLAIAGGLRAAQANTGSVYMALDRPQYASAITALGLVLTLGPFALALSRMPLADAVWFVPLGVLLTAAVNLTLLTRMLDLAWSSVLAALARPAIGIAAMAAVLLALRPLVWSAGRPLGSAAVVLVGLVLIGAVAYLGTVLLLWRLRGAPPDAPEHAVLATVTSAFARRRPA